MKWAETIECLRRRIEYATKLKSETAEKRNLCRAKGEVRLPFASISGGMYFLWDGDWVNCEAGKDGGAKYKADERMAVLGEPPDSTVMSSGKGEWQARNCRRFSADSICASMGLRHLFAVEWGCGGEGKRWRLAKPSWVSGYNGLWTLLDAQKILNCRFVSHELLLVNYDWPNVIIFANAANSTCPHGIAFSPGCNCPSQNDLALIAKVAVWYCIASTGLSISDKFHITQSHDNEACQLNI